MNVLPFRFIDESLENLFTGKFHHDKLLAQYVAVHVPQGLVARGDHFAAKAENDLAGQHTVFPVLVLLTGKQSKHV